MARRSGLGKGLGALLPTDVLEERSSSLREVAIGSIRPNPMQPRVSFDEESMVALAASIKELGVLQPILVREIEDSEEYELIAGERRWRAARRAGLQTIPVIVQTADDLRSLEHALVENLHRQDLNALEEAAAYQQLIEDFGYTHEVVATRVGKSRATVSNTLRLLQLPTSVQSLLGEGAIDAGHARALLGSPDRAFQEVLARRIVAEGLTVRAVEDEVRRQVHGSVPAGEEGSEAAEPEPAAEGEPPTRPAAGEPPAVGEPPEGTRKLPPPGILELEELLSTHLETRVKVDMAAKRGRVMIDFANLEDLERIYRLMVGG